MKHTKYIISFLIIILCTFPLIAEKRKARLPMKELTDPNSPSFVPIPYPKNRKEIFVDFKYYVKTYCVEGKFIEKRIDNSPSTRKIVSRELLKPDSKYRFGEVIKVKNRREMSCDDYYWLIPIYDKKGDVVMRLEMLASGLFASAATLCKTSSPKMLKRQEKFRKVLKEDDVREILFKALGNSANKNDIKSMERLASYPGLGDSLKPLWEITMNSGKIYYYSIVKNRVYDINKRVSWKKDKRGGRPLSSSIVPDSRIEYLTDTISDEIIFLKEVTEK